MRHAQRRSDKVRVWLLEHLPAGVVWHPAEWFLAFLCAFSGVVTLTTPAQSNSVEALLPSGVYRTWAAFLVVGAFGLARGLSSVRWLEHDRYVITRVPAYRFGLRLLGISMIVYVICLFAYAGVSGLFASIAPLAFIAMCGIRLLALWGTSR